MSTLYMGADQETVAKYVLFSGDPWRVEVVKQYLENPKKWRLCESLIHIRELTKESK
mgnify:CR=1 FL=1